MEVLQNCHHRLELALTNLTTARLGLILLFSSAIFKLTETELILLISVDAKLSAGRLKDDVLARITVAMPKPRDSMVRGPSIPASVSAVKMAVENGERITEKQLMLNNG